jgi:hypothetical protein
MLHFSAIDLSRRQILSYLKAASVSRAELSSCCHSVACFRKQLGRAINGRKAEN